MGLRLWHGGKFETTHERQALTRLLREMVTRFGSANDPYALLIDFQVGTAKIDLMVLTARAIIVLDLKEGGGPGAVIRGTVNGEWRVEHSDGSHTVLNKGRGKNPYQQLDGYRWEVIEWLDRYGEQIFGEQKRKQLEFAHVGAWLALSPALDEERTRRELDFLPEKDRRWFRVVGLNSLCDHLFAEISPGICLTEQEIEKMARLHGLTEVRSWEGLVWPGELTIPSPPLFGPPPVPRGAVDRDDILQTALHGLRNGSDAVAVIGGTGGVGKTFLAGMLAHALDGQYRIYWVDCGPARRCEPTLDALLSALAHEIPNQLQAQVVADKDQSLNVRIDTALRFCESSRVCLFLDDYHELRPDHGLDKFIRRLDRCCRQTRVVVTSRKRPDFLVDLMEPIQSCLVLDLGGLVYLSSEKGTT